MSSYGGPPEGGPPPEQYPSQPQYTPPGGYPPVGGPAGPGYPPGGPPPPAQPPPTQPPGYPPPAGQQQGGASGAMAGAAQFAERHIRTPETKEFFKTSEFGVWLVGVIALLIAAAASDNLNAPLAWTLVTAISFAYIISRGVAKAGTKRDDRRF